MTLIQIFPDTSVNFPDYSLTSLTRTFSSTSLTRTFFPDFPNMWATLIMNGMCLKVLKVD